MIKSDTILLSPATVQLYVVPMVVTTARAGATSRRSRRQAVPATVTLSARPRGPPYNTYIQSDRNYYWIFN